MVAMYLADAKALAAGLLHGTHLFLWDQLDTMAAWLEQTKPLHTVNSDIAVCNLVTLR